MELSRYCDVAAALRDPRLVPVSAQSTAPAVPLDSKVHEEFRAQALRALSAGAIQPWEAQFARRAQEMAAALPVGEPVELMERYARPWSLEAAAITAGVSSGECVRLADLARAIFDSACEPHDAGLAAAAHQATVQLAASFRGAPAWTVQMFTALAHSLPALLGNAWLALAEQGAETWNIDNLMRIAGPAKAVFRQATAPLTIGDTTIEPGERVILRLDLANRDPEGRDAAHLAFGAGAHACVGATLIRAAAAIATNALFDRFRITAYTAIPAEHTAMRYLQSLEVTLALAVSD